MTPERKIATDTKLVTWHSGFSSDGISAEVRFPGNSGSGSGDVMIKISGSNGDPVIQIEATQGVRATTRQPKPVKPVLVSPILFLKKGKVIEPRTPKMAETPAQVLAFLRDLARRARRREARRKTELKNVFVLYFLRRQGVKYFFFSPICDLVATVAAA